MVDAQAIRRSIIAAQGAVNLDVEGYSQAAIQISGTWSATLEFEGTINGDDWFALDATPVPSAATVADTTANGQWNVQVGGLTTVRVRCSAYTSGSAQVIIRAVAAGGGGGSSSGGGGGASTADGSAFETDDTEGTIAMGVYQITPDTITDEEAAAIAIDDKRNTKVREQYAPGYEDNTNHKAVVEHRYTSTRLTADGQVKAGAGFVHTLTFAQTDAAPTAGTITVYDSLTETGTIIYSETFDTTTFRGYSVLLDVTYSLGLFVGFTTTADVGVTVSGR